MALSEKASPVVNGTGPDRGYRSTCARSAAFQSRPARLSVLVEHALRDTTKPIGVAGYTAGKALPADVRDRLPSPERLEEELRKRRPRRTSTADREPRE